MGAPTENEFWRLRKDLSETGKKLSPDEVIEKAQEYIDYCRNTPLNEIDFRGKDANEVTLPKMRAMTIKGLCLWLDISDTTWGKWKKDEKYVGIITRIENLIYVYKFEGAAAGMLKENLIARELGLTDKKDFSSSDGTMTPKLNINVTSNDAKKALEDIANGND